MHLTSPPGRQYVSRRAGARGAALVVTALSLAALTACSTAAPPDSPRADSPAPASSTRLAVSTAGEITVLDSDPDKGMLAVVGSVDSEEFTRLNAFGDGRHLVVSTSHGFEVLDTQSVEFTGFVFAAESAGHVVRHDGTTTLFDDHSGRTTVLGSDALLQEPRTEPESLVHDAAAPHHGVSISLADGTLVTTVGTPDERSGAVALEPHGDHWHELTASDECPGIHGEGTAANEAVVFGCEDGALVYASGAFTKLTAPDAFGRMGNAYATSDSPFVVGDYKNDPDAEGYLLDKVALINTAAPSFVVHELPEHIRYTYRDIVRGPNGYAYILSTDGAIHVMQPETGEIIDSFDVIAQWQGPSDWQEPHPSIVADGNVAYVTEPQANAVHTVSLQTGEVLASVTLPGVPNEIAVAVGASQPLNS